MATAAEREDAVRDALAAVLDPELGINIVDLGLVYGIEATAERIAVTMTMTTPACPLGELLAEEAARAIRSRVGPGPTIDVCLVWDPPWSPARMTAEARRQLGR